MKAKVTKKLKVKVSDITPTEIKVIGEELVSFITTRKAWAWNEPEAIRAALLNEVYMKYFNSIMIAVTIKISITLEMSQALAIIQTLPISDMTEPRTNIVMRFVQAIADAVVRESNSITTEPQQITE